MAQPVASHLWCSKFKLYFKMSLGIVKFRLIERQQNKQTNKEKKITKKEVWGFYLFLFGIIFFPPRLSYLNMYMFFIPFFCFFFWLLVNYATMIFNSFLIMAKDISYCYSFHSELTFANCITGMVFFTPKKKKILTFFSGHKSSRIHYVFNL